MEELIYKYFPELTSVQREKIKALYPVYSDWNSKINVISRKDFDNFYVHHVLHSLAIAKFINFPAGSRILDVGTGGGFPGIPLAILFPESSFFLCDSILKKIKVVQSVTEELKLTNVTSAQVRAEDINDTFDFVVTRAVTELKNLIPWIWNKCIGGQFEGRARGLIALKGGDTSAEIKNIPAYFRLNIEDIKQIEVSEWFKEEYFAEKRLIFIKR
jgi:16S rRNA (guanine527-N7)-methyltransferase